MILSTQPPLLVPVPCRFTLSNRHRKERAQLCGCSSGSDVAAIAVPFMEALAGPVGVLAACSSIIANCLSGRLLGVEYSAQLLQQVLFVHACMVGIAQASMLPVSTDCQLQATAR